MKSESQAPHVVERADGYEESEFSWDGFWREELLLLGVVALLFLLTNLNAL